MSIKMTLNAQGYDSFALDEVVIEQFESLASSVCNDGRSAQIEFLNRYANVSDADIPSDPEALDEMVYEQAGRLASAINNDGMGNQIDFLSEQGVTNDTILSTVKENANVA